MITSSLVARIANFLFLILLLSVTIAKLRANCQKSDYYHWEITLKFGIMALCNQHISQSLHYAQLYIRICMYIYSKTLCQLVIKWHLEILHCMPTHSTATEFCHHIIYYISNDVHFCADSVCKLIPR